VIREEASEDRRYQEIKLTPKAKRLVPKLSEIADENDSSFFSLLSAAEKDQLRKSLLKLAALHKLNLNPIE
ncbi:MarR family transcriptional regulator, partial [Leptospira bourretii]